MHPNSIRAEVVTRVPYIAYKVNALRDFLKGVDGSNYTKAKRVAAFYYNSILGYRSR
jgi:hypothetical protein